MTGGYAPSPDVPIGRLYGVRMSRHLTIEELRSEYESEGLDFSSLDPDPIEQFSTWFALAIDSGVVAPNTMVLATAAQGAVSARAVLLKGFDAAGFVFFTNLESDKGIQMLANPRAALTFVWAELHRQVRVEGTVAMVSERESDDYFASRPRGAQLASAASRQSRVIGDRRELERAIEELAAELGDGPVPRPARWGGVRVLPTSIEFWQGRGHRLHDRARYIKDGDGWRIERLAP